MRTRHLSLVTSTHLDITRVKSNVLSPYGPVRAGLTTWQPTNDQVLEELLSSLESVVQSLNYKSSTLLDTLSIATQAVSVALSSTPIEGVGTDV